MKKFPDHIKKARDEFEAHASKIAEPTRNVMNTMVIGGVTAGLLLGAAYLIKQIRK